MNWNDDAPPPPGVTKLIDRLSQLGKQSREEAARHPAVTRTARGIAAGVLATIVLIMGAVGVAISSYGAWHHTRKDHFRAVSACALHADCAIWRIEAVCERGWLARSKTGETFEERGRTAAEAVETFTPWEPDCRVVAVTHLRPLVDRTATLAPR